MINIKKKLVRILCGAAALSMLPLCASDVMFETVPVYAESTAISAMDYFSPADGPQIVHEGVREASYGFVMPVFNGGSASWEEVSDDLRVSVITDGKWQDIETVPSFTYNKNWGHWFDGGFVGYWFTVDKSTRIQLSSKKNPSVALEYELIFNKLDSLKLTNLNIYDSNHVDADPTGSAAVRFPMFNGDRDVKYEQVADDIELLVKPVSQDDFVSISNNPDSGWIYDKNFGNYDNGFWFQVKESTWFMIRSRTDPSLNVYYYIEFEAPVRKKFKLTPAGDTTIKADEKGAAGLALPNIGGGAPYEKELSSFVYEVLRDGEWISLSDPRSGFSYKDYGYSTIDPATQWGYWADHVYGLWFQPVTEDCTIRIGYPETGVKGDKCISNYVEYTIIGNPAAPRPAPIYAEPIELGTADMYMIDGWNMIWNDEFENMSVDSSKWTHETGYYLDDDPNTWGWGNNELEYYTDSEENSFVRDGKLTIRLLNEPKAFDTDPSRIAPYSSGKLVTKDKFRFKYGRIDFCAKLPAGAGLWPALWMLPNDNVYGTWAASGEIDVMEARGRVTDTVCGTIHYGSQWPGNKHSGSDYYFERDTYDDGFHVYSCIWEKENIRWYVDGQCYSVIPYTEWESGGARDNPYAPFDQEFYIIMNLAAGGNFDGGTAPDSSSLPAQMQVEYVRVYQAHGDSSGTYTIDSGNNVNAAFLVRLSNWLLGKSSDSTGLDFDGNGRIDVYDLVKARKAVIS